MLTEINTLSKDDITALRTADNVSFHHSPINGSRIVASKRVATSKIFSGENNLNEFTRTVDCYPSFAGIVYGDKPPAQSVNCFSMRFSSKYCDIWQTIIRCMHIGDRLILHWARDTFNNGYVARATITVPNENGINNIGAPLHADALYLQIHRKLKSDKTQRLSFLIDVSICINNSARMIKDAE